MLIEGVTAFGLTTFNFLLTALERVWPVALCQFEFETRTLCHAIGLYIKHTSRATVLQAVIHTVCLASVASILCIAISGHVTNNSHTIGLTPHSVVKQNTLKL